MPAYDVIVLGVGGVGSAALMHLARRGVRALGIDRFPPGHDRGSSHGQTRLIRQAYFEHPDYVPLVRRAFDLWEDLERASGQSLYRQVGLLQVGPAGGHVLRGVRESARQHGLEIENLSARDCAARFPSFTVLDEHEAAFERRAGYLLVEPCVQAHAREAERLGAELRLSETIRAWRADASGCTVETDHAHYVAGKLVIAAGAWAGQLLADLGTPFEVRRKPLFWFRTRDDSYAADNGCPGYFYELPEGCFYGFPQIDAGGIKVAEHTGGAVVPDPLTVNRDLDPHEQQRVAHFVSHFLPRASTHCTDHAVCLYTMTPDEHFVVDRHPDHPQVAFAAGLSGHGFKFTPVLGEALADLALNGATDLPIGFLSASRPGLRTAATAR
ncbi:MAG: N-methyl-L-tryptophan oxidase [Pirellulales bacterium]